MIDKFTLHEFLLQLAMEAELRDNRELKSTGHAGKNDPSEDQEADSEVKSP